MMEDTHAQPAEVAAAATRRRQQLYRRLTLGLVAATSAYAWFATVQYGHLNDLNQRQLAYAATELKRVLANAGDTVRRFEPADGCKSLRSFDADQPYLTLRSAPLCESLEKPFTTVEPTDSPSLGLEATSGSGKTLRKIAFDFNVDVVLRELAFPEAFSHVFVARADGTVLYEESPTNRTWRRRLRWGEQQFRDGAADQPAALTVHQLRAAFGEDKAAGWPHLQSMSSRTTMWLGGQMHQAYLEPLVLANGTELALTLAGVVPTTTLIGQALALDSYLQALIVVVLLLSVLGFPFVKLLSLEAHERFTLRDVTLLYLSTAALLAFGTFAIEALDGYARWQARADEGLQTLAQRLDTEFVNEVGSIVKRVDQYDQLVAKNSVKTLETTALYVDWWRELPAPGGPNGRTAQQWWARGRPQAALRAQQDLHIETVSWIAPTGAQIWKITADPISARLKDVSTRPYFRAVRDGNLFEGEAGGPDFYVGPDRSITDGKFYTFVAIESRVATCVTACEPGRVHPTVGSAVGSPYVTAATARLRSLSTVALPSNYGFALISRDGRVLYHSDDRLSLRENLFEEMSQGAQARAMVYAGQPKTLTSEYRERPHEFYFSPVSLRRSLDRTPAGLSIVTFRDTSVERSIVARVFAVALFGPTLILLGFICLSLVLIALVPICRQQHWSVWFWPHGGLASVYKRTSAMLLAILIVSVTLREMFATDAVLAVMPVVALAATIGIYVWSTRATPARVRMASKGWHSVVFVLFLLCTIVVPAAAIFRAALDHELGKWVAAERAWIEARATDAPIALAADLRAQGRFSDMGGEMPVAMAPPPAPAPAPFDREPAATSPTTHWLLAPFHWADQWLPVDSGSAARTRYHDLGKAGGSAAPASPAARGWGILGHVAMLGVLGWWLRWKAVRLFFADLEAESVAGDSPETLWTESTPDQRLVLVSLARGHIVNPYLRPAIRSLLHDGRLVFGPDLRPSSEAFARYLCAPAREEELATHRRQWEASESSHSWRYARVVLLASAGGLGIFLLATQPALQSSVVAVATGVTGAATAALRLRDALASWLGRKTEGASAGTAALITPTGPARS